MQEAGQHLVGEHDYRNLCKMDVGNGVVNFRRRILAVRVERVKREGDGDGGGGRVASAEGENCCDGDGNGDSEKRGVSVRGEDGDCGDGSSKEKHEGREAGRDSRAVADGSDGGDGRACGDGGGGYEMCVATIEGQAFLWHQVRAVMAVLFLVGEGKERPDIVLSLLDVQTHPR